MEPRKRTTLRELGFNCAYTNTFPPEDPTWTVEEKREFYVGFRMGTDYINCREINTDKYLKEFYEEPIMEHPQPRILDCLDLDNYAILFIFTNSIKRLMYSKKSREDAYNIFDRHMPSKLTPHIGIELHRDTAKQHFCHYTRISGYKYIPGKELEKY